MINLKNKKTKHVNYVRDHMIHIHNKLTSEAKSLDELKGKMVASYKRTKSLMSYYDSDDIVKFYEGITFKKGKKYIKVCCENGGRAWGFINVGNPKFKVGDILMAKNYNSPALNKARGNIYDDYEIDWTGPKYLYR